MAGAVILARHGEPALSRRVLLSAKAYRDWWARYEEGGLKPGQSAPEPLLAAARGAGAIIASTRLRARESARAVTGGDAFETDPLFIEAPLPSPPLPDWFRLSPRLWGVLSRMCWWYLNYHDGQESRAEAEVRADLAARRLAERAAGGEDVLLVAHGFFNYLIGRALLSKGWKRTLDQGFQYWSTRRFEPPARAA